MTSAPVRKPRTKQVMEAINCKWKSNNKHSPPTFSTPSSMLNWSHSPSLLFNSLSLSLSLAQLSQPSLPHSYLYVNHSLTNSHFSLSLSHTPLLLTISFSFMLKSLPVLHSNELQYIKPFCLNYLI